jgi:hypothetical protein
VLTSQPHNPATARPVVIEDDPATVIPTLVAIVRAPRLQPLGRHDSDVGAPSRTTCLCYVVGMADPAPPVIRDILDHAWVSAQRLAIEVIEYPTNKRDQVMQCMGSLLVEVARQAGCPHEAAREFGAAMEQTIRGYVSEIEASGGGTIGTA